MSEKSIEQKLVSEVKKRGGFCWKFVSMGIVGVPDRILLFKGGVIHHIVTKDTIDENVINALEKKNVGQSALIEAVKWRLME